MQSRSVIQCPHCGFKVVEKIAAGDPPHRFVCPACEQTATVEESRCCVYCALGTVPCRRRQSEEPQES